MPTSSRISTEWKSLPPPIHPKAQPAKYKTGLQNANQNRYSDIIPFESTRVQLDSHEYINANHVTLPTDKMRFIATQAPISSSFDTFWKMVWENNVHIIVMLTKILEGRKIKASCYWPSINKPELYDNKRIKVSLNSVTEDGFLIIRDLTVSVGQETRNIHHVQYTEWPDFGVPASTQTIRKLICLVQTFESSLQSKHIVPTAVVHCSAGIGRCGTFLAILAADYLRQQNLPVDIPKIVCSLRECRMGMVQTREQYAFIYSAIEGLEGLQPKLSRSVDLSQTSFVPHYSPSRNYFPASNHLSCSQIL